MGITGFSQEVKEWVKMQATQSSETLVCSITTWCHNQEDNKINHHSENLKSYSLVLPQKNNILEMGHYVHGRIQKFLD
jgi:hypothetical protein